MKFKCVFYVLLVLVFIITACNPQTSPTPVTQPVISATAPSKSRTAVPPANTSTTTATATKIPLSTLTPTPSATHTTTPIPTYVYLRGQMLVRSNCRYGPGAPYLYKYGLVPGSNLEIIGRNDLGTWILIRAIGGTNPCWVKTSLLDIKGDVMDVAPTYIALPQSPYYEPPRWVQATREGEIVTVYWKPVNYRPGDETAEAPYLIEAWVCRDGKLVFIPIGIYETQTIIIDEPGCSEPSHGRIYFVEKHGYSLWRKIPWPPPETDQTSK